jgi:hypothetical protein
LGLATLLGFVVLRGPATEAEPTGAASVAARLPAAPPSVALAPPAAAPSVSASAEVSAPKGSVAPPARPAEGRKVKARISASAHIPTDLENPF